MTEKEMQFRDKQELKGTGELTKPGLTFIPAVDIFENEEALTMMAGKVVVLALSKPELFK